MRNLGGEIDVMRSPLERIEILGKALPLPIEPLGHDDFGYVFDSLHHADEKVPVRFAARRKTDAAIAHHDARHAVLGGRCEIARPDGLTVIVGVNVDKARRDDVALGVDFLIAAAREWADGGDPAILYGVVDLAGCGSDSIDQSSASQNEIEVEHVSFPAWFCSAAVSAAPKFITAVMGSEPFRSPGQCQRVRRRAAAKAATVGTTLAD